MDKLIEGIGSKMDKVLAVVAEDMATIRVGGANPKMVESVEINAYGGQRMRLMEVASISAPDPNQIVISPWDKSVIKDIEKGIIEANLGFMPNVSGEVIRIVVPPLTEERRRDFVKLVGQKLESGRVMLRGVRQEGREEIEKLEEEAGVSEDDVKRLYEELDKLTGEYNDRLEQIAQEKEAEVMKV